MSESTSAIFAALVEEVRHTQVIARGRSPLYPGLESSDCCGVHLGDGSDADRCPSQAAFCVSEEDSRLHSFLMLSLELTIQAMRETRSTASSTCLCLSLTSSSCRPA